MSYSVWFGIFLPAAFCQLTVYVVIQLFFGSILIVICGLSLLLVLVLVLAPRVFLRVLRFSSLLKN